MIRLRAAVTFASILILEACSLEPELKMPRAVIDLSPTMGEDFPVKAIGQKALEPFGITAATEFKLIIVEDPFYVADARITLFNHVGPHHDPPNHLIKGAKSTDQIPLENFYGRAKLFDFRSKPKDEPLLPTDFENQRIEPGDIVISFVGYTPPTDPEALPSYAYLSGEAAEYLANIPIKAFASDMPSLGSITRFLELIERGLTDSENLFPEHIAFLSRDIPNIEGLVNLESLVGEEEIVFVGFPLKIEDGNGAPIRAAALVY